jgi:hypothetical protein
MAAFLSWSEARHDPNTHGFGAADGDAMNDEKISLIQAARAIHRRYEFVRELVDTRKVPAWDRGGKKHKRLVVNLADVKAAVDRETRYVPPAKKTRRTVGKLDPMVKC